MLIQTFELIKDISRKGEGTKLLKTISEGIVFR